MIASRLVAIARDIYDEYQRFDLTALLREASNLSSNRPNLNAKQYKLQSDGLKEKAQAVLDQTIFRTYPLDTMKLLAGSELSSILPNTIANLIIAGFPDRKENAISSAELNMYLTEAQQLLAQINGVRDFSERLGVRPYLVPESKVALDLKIPRHLFSNDLRLLEKKLASFTRFFESVSELSLGRKEPLELLYISTTDPLFSIAILGPAAFGILKFYKLLLEVAIAHVNLKKALVELKKSQMELEKITNVQESIDATINKEVERAVTKALNEIPKNVEQERQNELHVLIKKDAVEIVANLAGGARIFVTIESQQQINLLAPDSENLTTVREEIEQQKTLESKLDAVVLGHIENPVLIENRSPDN
jgi:hypothetical protein